VNLSGGADDVREDAVRAKIACVLALLLVAGAGSLASARAKRRAVVHPVVWARDGLVLGGTVNGRWADDIEVGERLRGGERYRLYALGRHYGTAIGTKPHIDQEPWYRGAYLLALSPLPKIDGTLIAVGGNWNALPRVTRAERTDQPAHLQALASFLVSKGIAKPDVRINQALRIDLEGDGTDEVLISAGLDNNEAIYNMKHPTKGDYSCVVLRKIVDGKVRMMGLSGWYFTHTPSEDERQDTWIHSINSVLDLNGDGVMEVITHWSAWEGEGVGVHAICDGRTRRVLVGGGGV
jgi:hypothetical protein